MASKRLVAACALILFIAGTASAGPVLDDILNYMFMDQTVPMKGPQDLWIVDRHFPLTKDEPVGQTFTTGPETEQIVRVQACVAANSLWKLGEGAELILWDSPEKKVSLGRYTIWYEFRGYHYNHVQWEIRAKVKPNTTYYFEISYVGDGDGKLGSVGVMNGANNYKSGQGYLAGKEADFDLCFQIHSKRAPDRVGNLKKAFARFDLNRPELAEIKQAVEKEDFETAVAKTVAYFEARQEPMAIIKPEDIPDYDPSYDTRRGDMAMHNYFDTTDGGKGYAGPDLNWRADVDFDEDGNKIAGDFDLNRYGARGALVSPYLNTGNEKYAKKFNDMMIDWFLDNPPPPESNIGGCPWDGVWASLQTGIRLGQSFYAYSAAHASPFFTTDCRFAWIMDLADHADTLVAVGEGAGGNWSFTQNGSLMTHAVNFPEYTNSKLWFDTAARRITNSIEKDYLPDGVETEAAPGYQRFAYKPVANLLDLLQERKVKSPFSAGIKDLLEKHAEYFMYLSTPDGSAPFLGDWGGGTRSSIEEDAKRFNRQDMLYVATAGKEGTKPKELSKLYPYCGIVTIRSDWGDVGKPYEDARYLMLHGLHFGAHGHADINSITVYAHGREILTDPGSYVYSSPEHALLNKAVSHNLMTVDGMDQNRNGKTAFRNWSTTPIADYLSSFVAAYKEVGYNREVFYIRGNDDPGAKDYWIVKDTAEGTSNHTLEQRWHFALESDVTVDKATLAGTTSFADKGNLAVMQVDPSALTVEETTIDTWQPRGSGGPPQKLPTLIYKKTSTLPAAIDTVLFPYKGKEMPKIQLKTLEKNPDGMDSAFKIIQGKVEDAFIMQKAAGQKTLKQEKISFDGEKVFVRKVGGKLRSVLLINGSSLTIGGKQIIKLVKPEKWIVVEFGKSGRKEYRRDL